MMPTEPGSAAPPRLDSPAPEPQRRRVEYRWYHKMSAVLLITFCLEVGLFLLIYPWTDSWDNNYFGAVAPGLRQFWGNMYVRGGISGLGVINLYISLAEVFRLRRFSRH